MIWLKHIITFIVLGVLTIFSSQAQSLSLADDHQINGPVAFTGTNKNKFNGMLNDSSQSQKRMFGSLEDRGISFGISETLEGYHNFSGGKRIGNALVSTFDANLNIDLQKLLDLSGGVFYVDLEDHAGDNPTKTLIGDFQVFDKHNAAPFLQILEIWYQQKLFNNTLRLKIGKVDANTEFSLIDNGLEFINSSTQVTPTLFVFPTFPDPMPSINLFFTPDKLVYTNFSVYDANQKDRFLDFYGDPASVQPSLFGELLMSESGLTWDNLPVIGGNGNFKMGLWEHTGSFMKYGGGVQHGAEGIYLIFNQTLWKPVLNENESRGIRMFLEFTRSDSLITPIYQHFGGGVAWTGLSAKRPEDAMGISIQYGSLSTGLNVPQHFELNNESFYKIKLNSWLGLKLDIQYIVHPGGQYPNAFLATLLLTIAFNS